ncbi:MAG TPA: metallophosphoesterase [Actinomycetota bacterium]|nr:metallophosphoesterase [Actinomycetota bacterium]
MELEPDPAKAPRWRRISVPRWLEIALAAVLLSLALMAAAVRGEYDLGPGKVEISLWPQLQGATVVSIPPFGSIEAFTHRSPVAVVISPTSVDTHSAQELVESRPTRSTVVESLRTDLIDAFKQYALQLLIGGLVAGLLTAAIARVRSWQEIVVALTAGVIAPLALYGAAFAGYNPDAFRQPTLTGAISRSPELLGPVQQFGQRFNALRTELDEIGSITFQLYQFLAEQNPLPEDAIRVLHISDLHLNPVGYDVAQLVADRFEVEAVIDSGDITAEGTPIELGFLDRIPGFDVPYIFIRGNHDSAATQDAVAAKPNARVLDGTVTEIGGLRVFGVGDPLFTPDKTVEQPSNDEQKEAKRAFSRTVEEQVEALDEDPDVVVVHDKLAASRLHGNVNLILHGHEHKWSAQVDQGTRILGVGSTGAAGLKSMAPESDSAIALQVLYFDREDHRLLGYDRIDVIGPQQQFLLKRTMLAPEPPAELELPGPAESPTPPVSATPVPETTS